MTKDLLEQIIRNYDALTEEEFTLLLDNLDFLYEKFKDYEKENIYEPECESIYVYNVEDLKKAIANIDDSWRIDEYISIYHDVPETDEEFEERVQEDLDNFLFDLEREVTRKQKQKDRIIAERNNLQKQLNELEAYKNSETLQKAINDIQKKIKDVSC